MIQSQWTSSGFMTRFEENQKVTSTYLEAYNLTESEHLKAFGINRYKNYDAFRQVRKSLIQKK